jgi:hypothetical protein
MQTKFKRHQKVVLLREPNPEYVEYYGDNQEPIKKGMQGRINILLPNGQYHIEILNNKWEVIAYAPMAEEDLEAEEEMNSGESADDS